MVGVADVLVVKGMAHSAITVKGVQGTNRKVIGIGPAMERQTIISGHCPVRASGSEGYPVC